jgi:hypothetical protein
VITTTRRGVKLTDAGSTGVGKNHAAEFLEGLKLTVALNGSANLLTTGGDSEQRLGLDAVGHGVLGNGGGTGHVLVGGVRAGTDKTDLELLGPVVGLDSLGELGDGGGQIGGEGTVDVGLKRIKVDLDELVVLGALVLAELVSVLAGEVTDVLTLGGLQVVVHAVVKGENGGGSTDLSTHVANGSHTSARQGLDTRAVVLNNGTSSTLDGEDTSNLEDDVLGRGPARKLTSELDTDNLGGLQLPGETSHNIDSIST